MTEMMPCRLASAQSSRAGSTSPVGETVTDTWAWLSGLGGGFPMRPDRPATGLAPEREQAFLQARRA